MNSSNNLCSYARSRAKTRIVSRFEKDLLLVVAIVATYSMNFHPLVVTVVYIIALASASELSPCGPTIE